MSNKFDALLTVTTVRLGSDQRTGKDSFVPPRSQSLSGTSSRSLNGTSLAYLSPVGTREESDPNTARWRIKVKSLRRSKLSALLGAIAVTLLASSTFAATASKTRQLTQGEKAKVSGVILSRDGDLVRLRDKRTHEVVTLNILDATQIERENHKFPFYRHTDMDVTALLPGLTIEAEGVANSNGQLEASKISFAPDDFAIEVAQQQQVLANKAAAQNAQSTANEAGTAAGAAQTSADQAQNSADQSALQAQAAGVVGLADAAAIAAVDQRVSDLDDRHLPILPNSRSHFTGI